MTRPVELLAPAKDLECGIEAVRHGADAVYIGAPRFSARAAAGNSLEDIAELASFAHLYNARVYAALNTILRNEELHEAKEMIWQLYRIGVDAVIVQDMSVMMMDIPPIALHASTQTDNRSIEKVAFLSEAGFTRTVLARELSLKEISDIHKACPKTELEVFVHGALCVSYSGQCYASQACFRRSANRGECAQFCRLAFDMEDADGNVIVRDKHLLSLKDMNRNDHLEDLLDAGVTSLKIEGRLKDVTYVKNVTAYYRMKLDAILKRRPEYVKASSGKVTLAFRPQPEKSFSRGFTDYFLKGRNANIFSPDTPKSLGEEVGIVKEVKRNYLVVAGVKTFNNGDGICFIDSNGKLQGFRVNRAESNKLYPQKMPSVTPKTKLYRNFDQEFDRAMHKKSAERLISLRLTLRENNFGFTLAAADEDGNLTCITVEHKKELARTSQTENLKSQLRKLGGTAFEAVEINIELTDNWFIPSSELSQWRRKLIEKAMSARKTCYRRQTVRIKRTTHEFPLKRLTYQGNVMNDAAARFYHLHGVSQIAPAFENVEPQDAALMTCRHCLRYSMGWCPLHHKKRSPFNEPYYLVTRDGKHFRLGFDCKHCQMKVYADN